SGMRESLYGLLCALMLGIAQMCMYTGFDSSSFVVEPILHSVSNRAPGTIDTHAGYYGSAVCLVAYMFANLVAPWALGLLGSKLSLVLASSCLTLYFISFMYVHFIPYYLASALMGVGFALYYAGNGAYLTEHSSRDTIERNTTLVWTLGSFCMIIGGVVMLFTIKPPTGPPEISENKTASINETIQQWDFRQFSDSEIRLMYGAFAGAALLSNFLFAFLPKSAVANSLAKVNRRKHRIGLGEQLVKMGRTLADHRMVQIAPAFCLVGTTTTFWICVYPTTMTFTKKLSEHVYLPAYYSIVLGSAEIIMGCIIMVLSKRIRNFAQMPTLVIGAILYMTGALLALLSTPAWSTNTPNDDRTLWFEPSVEIVLLIALLFGLADNCFNTSRGVIAALVIPDQSAQVFSIAKFYQTVIACILTFLASWLSVPAYFVLITINIVIGLILFGRVAAKTHKNEQKITEATNGEAEAIPEKKIIHDMDH
ncbi:hypothetical protein PRIPAC_81133, partial [Pristionchus pacificus]